MRRRKLRERRKYPHHVNPVILSKKIGCGYVALRISWLKDVVKKQEVDFIVTKLSDEFQMQHKNVPWPQIVSMRNRLIHGYFGVSLKTIWQVVCIDIPDLYVKLKRL